MSLTSANKVGYWRIESNDEAWVVTAAFAMPAWQYRQLLSVAVRQTLRFINCVCQWAPELDPHALLLRTEWAEAILCWNKEIGAIAVLVPAGLSDEQRQLATQVACSFLLFAYSLMGNTLQPLSVFDFDDNEDKSWVTSAVVT